MGRKKKRILSMVLSVLIALSLTMCLMGLIIRGGLLNKGMFKDNLVRSNYYSSLVDDIKDKLKETATVYKLPEELIDKIVTDSLIYRNANDIFENPSAYEDGRVDTEVFQKEAVEVINDYLKENDVDNYLDIAAYVEKTARLLAIKYAESLDIGFISGYSGFVNRYTPAVNVYICVSFIIFAVLTALVIMLHKRKYRGVRYAGYGIISGSITTIIISQILKFRILSIVNNADITYNSVVTTFIDSTFSQGIYVGLVGVFVFGILCYLTLFLKSRSN